MNLLTPEEALLPFLCDTQPQRLLMIATGVPKAITDWCSENQCQLEHLPQLSNIISLPDQRYDAAVVVSRESLESDQLWPLGQLKNLYTSNIWLLCHEDTGLPHPDLLGLGFTRLQHFASHALSSYGYNLATYNHKRTWNTPKYWANPENWGKYWW